MRTKHVALLTLFLLPWLSGCAQDSEAWMGPLVLGGSVSSGDYCSSQSWNTFTDFRLDFDHTGDQKNACISGGTETGVLNNSATIVTPATVSPGSGGDALFMNADTRNIDFDNDTPYFDTVYGSLGFKLMPTGDNTSIDYILTVFHVTSTDRLYVYVNTSGKITYLWEDNNNATGSDECQTSAAADIDLDDYTDKWIEMQIRWDTTACTAGDGNCGAVHQIGARCRGDANGDGDFDDGGVESFGSFVYDGSTDDFLVWAAEPGTDDVVIGLRTASHTSDYYIDDVEISLSQPDMEN